LKPIRKAKLASLIPQVKMDTAGLKDFDRVYDLIAGHYCTKLILGDVCPRMCQECSDDLNSFVGNVHATKSRDPYAVFVSLLHDQVAIMKK
jgi:hypothetical protein